MNKEYKVVLNDLKDVNTHALTSLFQYWSLSSQVSYKYLIWFWET